MNELDEALNRYGVQKEYNPDEPRDEAGKWTSAGAEGTKALKTPGEKTSHGGNPFTHRISDMYVPGDSLDKRHYLEGTVPGTDTLHQVSATKDYTGKYVVRHTVRHRVPGNMYQREGYRQDRLSLDNKSFSTERGALVYAHNLMSNALDYEPPTGKTKEWDESKHPRSEDGRFSEGESEQGSPKTAKPKTIWEHLGVDRTEPGKHSTAMRERYSPEEGKLSNKDEEFDKRMNQRDNAERDRYF